MNVRELIELLKEFPEDAEVIASVRDGEVIRHAELTVERFDARSQVMLT